MSTECCDESFAKRKSKKKEQKKEITFIFYNGILLYRGFTVSQYTFLFTVVSEATHKFFENTRHVKKSHGVTGAF